MKQLHIHMLKLLCTLLQNLSTANQDLIRGAEQLTKLLTKTLNNDSTGTTRIRENLGNFLTTIVW